MARDYTRLINTGLKGKKGRDIIASVIGQLSDGAWENSNSPSVQGRWKFADNPTVNENDEVILPVNDTFGEYNHNNWTKRTSYLKNPYKSEDDQQIKNYYARKLRTLHNMEAKDYGYDKNSEFEHQYVSPYGTYEDDPETGKKVYKKADYKITTADINNAINVLRGKGIIK